MPNNNESKAKTLFNDFMDICETVIHSYFFIILVFTFIFSIARVDGDSMLPTLVNNERLIYSHLFYEPENGDIVIIDENDSLGKNIVKRVIADERQEVNIDFRYGKVYVDGQELKEDYINNLTTDDWGGFEYPVTVPEGCVFVLGDNRHVSLDSRDAKVGFVPKTNIIGHAIFRFYPTTRIGLID